MANFWTHFDIYKKRVDPGTNLFYIIIFNFLVVKITENRPLDDHRESAIWRFCLIANQIITKNQPPHNRRESAIWRFHLTTEVCNHQESATYSNFVKFQLSCLTMY